MQNRLLIAWSEKAEKFHVQTLLSIKQNKDKVGFQYASQIETIIVYRSASYWLNDLVFIDKYLFENQ